MSEENTKVMPSWYLTTVRSRKTLTERTIEEVHPDWVVSEKVTLLNHEVVHPMQITIYKEKGKFTFLRHVKTSTSEWVDVKGDYRFPVVRSFHIHRVKSVCVVKSKRKRRIKTPQNA